MSITSIDRVWVICGSWPWQSQSEWAVTETTAQIQITSHQRTLQQWIWLLIGCRQKKKKIERVPLWIFGLVLRQTDDWRWECRTQSSRLLDTEWNTVFQPAQYSKLCSAAEHWHTYTHTPHSQQIHSRITKVYIPVIYCQLWSYSIYCVSLYQSVLMCVHECV